jgi:hypothetical protein
MKSLTKKLTTFFLMMMIFLSQVSSSFTKNKSTRTKTKGITEAAKGFLVGFFFEISNSIDFHSQLLCIAQDLAFNLYDHKLTIKIEEKFTKNENHRNDMDEMSNVAKKLRRLKSINFTLISSLQSEDDHQNVVSSIFSVVKDLPRTLQSIKDGIEDSIMKLKPVWDFLNSSLVRISLQLLSCFLMSDSTESPVINKKNIISEISNFVKKGIYVGRIIAKLRHIPADLKIFLDSFNNDAVDDYDRYEILGRAIASIIRIYFKAQGLMLKKLK